MLDNPEITGFLRPNVVGDILPFPGQVTEFDLEKANEILEPLSAKDRIEWTLGKFGVGLYVLSSFGIDSALTIDAATSVASRSDNQPVKVLHVNTGFLENATLVHRDALQQQYRFQLYEIGPTEREVETIIKEELWTSNVEEYRRITKLNPLKEALTYLGATAFISGIRSDQTVNRREKRIVEQGQYGEFRIHPFIDWTKAKIAEYFASKRLPRHPLFYEGYTSIDDWPFTGPHFKKNECGLHVIDGGKIEQAS